MLGQLNMYGMDRVETAIERLKAFERMIDQRKANGMDCAWQTAEEVMEWWLRK